MKKISFAVLLFGFFLSPSFAEGEPMDSEDRLTAQEEDLRLVRETYDTRINEAMETLNENDSSAFFKARAEGKFATWRDFGIEMPSLRMFTVEEIPYGYRLKSKRNSRETATVLVYTRDDDLYYKVSVGKGVSYDFRRMVEAVFESDGETTSREGTPCDFKAVSCLHGYEMGTSGKSKK